MYQTILVPLDGSPFGEQALPMAMALVHETGARLVLVRATQASAMPGVDATDAQCRAIEEAETYLGNVVGQLAERGVRAEVAVPYAAAPEGILLEVGLCRADLIVMCTHGRSGLGRWLYGSVAEAVLAHSPVPVLLVRPGGSLATLVPQIRRARLLVPLDGSILAEAALSHAAELARALDGTIMLLRVLVPLIPQAVMTQPSWQETAGIEAGPGPVEEPTTAESYLAEAAGRLRQEGLRVQTAVRVGAAADAILQEAQTAGVQLIVMATHGHTGLKRFLMGSVALEVLRRGVFPLFLVRPAGLLEAGETSPS